MLLELLLQQGRLLAADAGLEFYSILLLLVLLRLLLLLSMAPRRRLRGGGGGGGGGEVNLGCSLFMLRASWDDMSANTEQASRVSTSPPNRAHFTSTGVINFGYTSNLGFVRWLEMG